MGMRQNSVKLERRLTGKQQVKWNKVKDQKGSDRTNRRRSRLQLSVSQSITMCVTESSKMGSR